MMYSYPYDFTINNLNSISVIFLVLVQLTGQVSSIREGEVL